MGEGIGWHPDHTGAALGKPLGLPVKELAPVAQTTSLPINLDSDIVVIGGPNATPFTMVAWEFTGSDTLQLGRRSDPTLPLRWYGLSDATDSSIQGDTRIGWEMEGVGPVATVNWPLVDAKNDGRLRRPRPSATGITIKGQTAYLPDENWLLITRLPNFLHSKFPIESGSRDPSYWPSLLVIEAAHGVGTRAAELLADQNALPMLEELETAVKGVEYFQALFIVSDLDLEREFEWTWKGPKRKRFHRFNTIGLEDVEPLDFGRDLFLKAHEQAAI
ncbi:hypothetical protein [Geodermatophilus sp. SYSU D01176]